MSVFRLCASESTYLSRVKRVFKLGKSINWLSSFKLDMSLVNAQTNAESTHFSPLSRSFTFSSSLPRSLEWVRCYELHVASWRSCLLPTYAVTGDKVMEPRIVKKGFNSRVQVSTLEKSKWGVIRKTKICSTSVHVCAFHKLKSRRVRYQIETTDCHKSIIMHCIR